MKTYFCPVCWQRAVRNKTHDVIWPHLDSIGADECPGSNHPYRIAIRASVSARITLRQAVSDAHQLLEAIAA
ncbi:hypothetical protein A3N99_02665 [Mycobacteroides abscessus]|uniref:hypothetical protein n=1 Tax=Mycobacteroides abscessus TaxID=36809 RepID=UPI00078B24AB|nr:hypothetical protein [Mycobacteroides abscessus]AMU39215.1 hypothetical protein A3N99_02665 [Mycobacteroides abscessus]